MVGEKKQGFVRARGIGDSISVGVKLNRDISVEGLDNSFGRLASDKGNNRALGLSMMGEVSDWVELSSELPAEFRRRPLLPFSLRCWEDNTFELSFDENTQCDEADLGTLAGHRASCPASWRRLRGLSLTRLEELSGFKILSLINFSSYSNSWPMKLKLGEIEGRFSLTNL